MEPYEGREPYIFISYARKDKAQVLPYLDALSGAGYRVWYDKGIKAGEHWTETLVEKVEACAVFCPLFSEAFNASRFCFEETDYAYRKDKPIVPAYLEELKPDDLRPLYRLLGSRQHLRLDDCNPAQFVESLKEQQIFEPCKGSEWYKVEQIQWIFTANGTLKIAKNEDLPTWFDFASIPAYWRYDNRTAAPWAPYWKKILSIEIADDIYAIGNQIFSDCENLTKALIGNRVTEIGNGTFSRCSRLVEVRIGDSVTKIDDFAFYDCFSLTNVYIPDGVTEIGDFAFSHCHRLTNVHIPDGVTEISISTFYDCHSLTNVHIPDSVTTIGNCAFAGCKSLTDIHIPDSVTTIGHLAFSDCENLKSVEVPAGVDCKYAFDNRTLVTRRNAP